MSADAQLRSWYGHSVRDAAVAVHSGGWVGAKRAPRLVRYGGDHSLRNCACLIVCLHEHYPPNYLVPITVLCMVPFHICKRALVLVSSS